MHSANYLPQLHHTKLLVAVLSAMLCLASVDSMAAESGPAAAPTLPDPSRNVGAMRLKLDLGLAMSGDDCEDDYADLMHVATASGSSAPAGNTPQPAAIGAGEALLAKLAPVEGFTASVASVASNATPDSATHIHFAQTAQTAQTAPAAQPAMPAVPAAQPWEIVPSDKTLNTALARWAAVAGWQLLWELPVDYAVDVRTAIHGSFEEAVGQVAKSMETAEIPMKAIFYEGNRVLRIVAKGAE